MAGRVQRAFFHSWRWLGTVLLLAAVGLLLLPSSGWTLSPDEVVVVANSRLSASLELARYYMDKRGIPADHLITVATSFDEEISRWEYDHRISQEVRHELRKIRKTDAVSCLVVMYGMPLKVRPPRLTLGDEDRLFELSEKLKILEQKSSSDTAAKKEIGLLKEKIRKVRKEGQRVAVDSELALVLSEPYPLDRWQENPYFVGFREKKIALKKNSVLLVGRLDGPDEKTVYRMINDSLVAEKEGLHGNGCFDARWPLPQKDVDSAYGYYDRALHRAAALVGRRLPVVVNEKEELFRRGECEKTALYSGWYSYGKYIDAFDWQVGSVGYHLASAECATLKERGNTGWCGKILENGAAATIGPVYEPFIQGFPSPDVFFAHLAEGYMSLGEAFLVSLPYLSWQVVLIGDPLYQPFRPL